MTAELGIIAASPTVFGVVMALVANGLSDEHSVLRQFLNIAALFTIVQTFWLAANVVHAVYPAYTEIIQTLGTLTFIFGMLFVIVLIYYCLYLFWAFTHSISAGKKEQQEQYGGEYRNGN